ncbi:hypothetical protein [Paenibacillus glycanilyticus]|uniref:hypothetical protein n=1 Tax=Paenibacillus glycanilyticus TaxID=126569 RepID=UPI003EBA9B1E
MQQIHLITQEYNKRNFLHRPSLKPLSNRILYEVKEAPRGTIFFYNMCDVEGINVSGVDEIIVKVLVWMKDNIQRHNKFLFLDYLNEEYDHEYNIGSSLLGIKECVVVKKDNTHLILGHLGKTLKEVVDIVYEKKSITARDLSDESGKKISLVSTQLSELFNLRLVNRNEVMLEEGGRQFIYQSLF